MDQFPVADVAMDKGVARAALQIGQIGRIAGIGELVEIDHVPFGSRAQCQPDKVGADKARTAGDQNSV